MEAGRKNWNNNKKLWLFIYLCLRDRELNRQGVPPSSHLLLRCPHLGLNQEQNQEPRIQRGLGWAEQGLGYAMHGSYMVAGTHLLEQSLLLLRVYTSQTLESSWGKLDTEPRHSYMGSCLRDKVKCILHGLWFVTSIQNCMSVTYVWRQAFILINIWETYIYMHTFIYNSLSMEL